MDPNPTKNDEFSPCMVVLASITGHLWFVTVGSNGIKAKSKGENGEVYLTLLQEHMTPTCETLMAKRHLAEEQHHWIFQEDNAKAHACKKVRDRLSSQCGFQVMQWLAKSPDLT
jgi:hypothetical protein